MSDANILRLIIAAFGALLLLVLYLTGQRKPQQGERVARREPGAERVEPTLGDADSAAPAGDLPEDWRAELARLGGGASQRRDPEPLAPLSPAQRTEGARGTREEEEFERVVTLYVAARDAGTIGGSELIVAAEKAGLTFGDREIFHRLQDGHTANGPIFSVANMLKPGSFDMAAISELNTPGVCFFMTLPGPLPALDAWDTMLAAAQRFAELLDAQVLDAQHNALGRQTIQHLRDDLRAYDRKRDKSVIKKSW